MQMELAKTGVLTQQEVDCLLGPSAVADSLRDLGELASQCRTIASSFSTALSSLLRTQVTIESGPPDNVAYRAVVKRFETPFCYSLLQSDAWKVPGMLIIDGKLALPIVARLLGADGGDSPAPLDRSLTEIESNLMRRVVDSFLVAARREWDAAMPNDLQLTRVASDVRLPLAVPLHQQTAIIRFQVEWERIHGAFHLCLPWSFAENLSNLKDSSPAANAVAELPADFISSDSIGLKVGDYLCTEEKATGQIVISINGQPHFYAVEAIFEGERALKLVSRLESTV